MFSEFHLDSRHYIYLEETPDGGKKLHQGVFLPRKTIVFKSEYPDLHSTARCEVETGAADISYPDHGNSIVVDGIEWVTKTRMKGRYMWIAFGPKLFDHEYLPLLDEFLKQNDMTIRRFEQHAFCLLLDTMPDKKQAQRLVTYIAEGFSSLLPHDTVLRLREFGWNFDEEHPNIPDKLIIWYFYARRKQFSLLGVSDRHRYIPPKPPVLPLLRYIKALP